MKGVIQPIRVEPLERRGMLKCTKQQLNAARGRRNPIKQLGEYGVVERAGIIGDRLPHPILLPSIADGHHATDRRDARIASAGRITSDPDKSGRAVHHLALPHQPAEKEDDVVIRAVGVEQRKRVVR
ncbi:hypothetical protein [Nitrobacter hamburgensis]|uniref:hypothetical protein n=1 Tax=Nitrobacter hamburgensis TaxID=912 RepID=UPI0009D655D0|nr:hypothetical protein [Nitrobacter hamburgensis]